MNGITPVHVVVDEQSAVAELVPVPFASLIARAFEEFDRCGSIFDLPARKFVRVDPHHDTSVTIHGQRVSTPLGPSAGPQTQMAQNIVQAWLAGARVFELKTVQVLDDITVPRPCIEAGAITYNVEWSQELRLEQSLEEYVKASMLIELLAANGITGAERTVDRPLFDMSVGYDAAGIRSARVTLFLRGLMDASAIIDRLRHEIPPRWRDFDFRKSISSTVTLSTFHGCPPGEIERIADFLMSEIGLDCTIKLNPTLLGADETRRILSTLPELVVPATAFENDPSWADATGMVDRLLGRADALGQSFGVKLTNSLIVENLSNFLPRSERFAYVSGAPLHVLAMHLVRRFRRTFGSAVPISFSAGIDAISFPDAVALGLAPVTTCTDLLRQGGIGRLHNYGTELARRMDSANAHSIGDFIIRAYGNAPEALWRSVMAADAAEECLSSLASGQPLQRCVPPAIYESWLSNCVVLNSESYVDGLENNPKYRHDRVARGMPKRNGHPLGMFDCSNCDLCIPACPNDAIMRLPSLEGVIPRRRLVHHSTGWWRVENGVTVLEKPYQIASFTDLCNDCGNCEIYCPDGGAPSKLKLRLFGSESSWRRQASLDGFFVTRVTGGFLVLGRIDGHEYRLDVSPATQVFSTDSFYAATGTGGTVVIRGDPPPEIDLYPHALMDYVRRATFDPMYVNNINCLDGVAS